MSDAADLRAESDMTNWYPRLKEVGVPTPYTVRVPVGEWTLHEDTINELTIAAPDVPNLRDAVRQVGGPRAFVRTSQASDKHSLAAASRIDYLDDYHLKSTVASLGSSMRTKMGVPTPEAYYVREWLDLEHQFKAFDQLPIARELRVFIHDGEVVSSGFYWPADAIRNPTDPEWETLLAETREDTLAQSEYVEDMAAEVADEFNDGYWSVDFARTTGGTWYCIDMARGELSWHPDACDKPDTVTDE